MAHKIILSTVLSAMFFCQPGRAETEVIQNEIQIPVATFKAESNYPTTFTLGPVSAGISYGRILNHWLELTATTLFQTYSSTVSAPGGTLLNFTAGPTLNFPISEKGVASAFFMTLEAGIRFAYLNSFSVADTAVSLSSQSTSDFAYNILVGKRFSILHNISWSPSISVSGFTGTDIFNLGITASPIFRIIPIQVSLLF